MLIHDTPLSSRDIIPKEDGPTESYIWAAVENGCLNVVKIDILSYHPATNVFLVAYNYDSGSYRRLVSAIRFDGYKPSDPEPVYGQVFAASCTSIDILLALAEDQNLVAWLTHLGVADPVRVAAKLQAPLPPIQPELPGLEPPAPPPPVAVKASTPSAEDEEFNLIRERIRAYVP
jgi:hypothetical protein